MNTYHLDLLVKHLKNALQRYCELCDSSPERKYFSDETILSQTKEIVQHYIRLFQVLHFLDDQTEYYHHGFIFNYEEREGHVAVNEAYAEIVKLLTEAYQRVAASVSKERFFLPIHVQQINTEQIQIFIGVVTKKHNHYTISIVTHHTVYPRPPASIGNNRYRYLVKMMEMFDPDVHGTVEAFVDRQGLTYRQISKDSTVFFGSSFYQHYLQIKMIPVLEDLLLSALSYKEIAYKNGFTSYHQLYTLFHKTYHFPFHRIPRISLEV